jgi:SH3-like domain-containing protein
VKPALVLALGMALYVALACPAWALDFRSTARPAMVYDAPSREGVKLLVASRGVPFEVLVAVNGWSKVRNADGKLGWIEDAALGTAHTVLVTAPAATVRQQPQALADAVFNAAKGLLLTVDGAPADGWLKVSHADGGSGWIPVADVWGK